MRAQQGNENSNYLRVHFSLFFFFFLKVLLNELTNSTLYLPVIDIFMDYVGIYNSI